MKTEARKGERNELKLHIACYVLPATMSHLFLGISCDLFLDHQAMAGMEANFISISVQKIMTQDRQYGKNVLF